MKVLHLPYTYFPQPSGGTEVYVADLARELFVLGVTSSIAYASASEPSEYEWEGFRVQRVGIDPPRTLDRLYSAEPEATVASFVRVVDRQQPDLVHVHAYTSALNGSVVETLRRMGYPLVTTYHTPTVTCQRGTLLRFGRTVCDGVMLMDRCAACVLQKLNVPRPLADLLGHLPPAAGDALGRAGADAGGWAALRMSGLMRSRHEDTRRFLTAPNAVIAPAEWVRTLLIANGVPPANIVLSPQGVGDGTASSRSALIRRPPGTALRAVMLSRVDPVKGLHVVLEALRRLRSLPIELDVYAAGPEASDYYGYLQAAVSRDRRVRLLPALSRHQVVSRIAEYDVLLAPSQTLETGPLVVLEAYAAGVPVIGSKLGGIKDLVRHDVDGWLVTAGSVEQWSGVLSLLVRDPDTLARWRAAVEPPRTMRDVALEMKALYCDLAPRAAGIR